MDFNKAFIWFYKGCFFNNDCSFSAVCGHKKSAASAMILATEFLLSLP